MAVWCVVMYVFPAKDNTAESLIIIVEYYSALYCKVKRCFWQSALLSFYYTYPYRLVLFFSSDLHHEHANCCRMWTGLCVIHITGYTVAALCFTFYQSTLIPSLSGLMGKPQLQDNQWWSIYKPTIHPSCSSIQWTRYTVNKSETNVIVTVKVVGVTEIYQLRRG